MLENKSRWLEHVLRGEEMEIVRVPNVAEKRLRKRWYNVIQRDIRVANMCEEDERYQTKNKAKTRMANPI